MEHENIYRQLSEAFDIQNLDSVTSGISLREQQKALQNYFDKKIAEKENHYYSDANPLIVGERKIDALILDVKTKLAKAQLEKKGYLVRHLSSALEKLNTAKENIAKSHAAFREFVATLKAEMGSVSDSIYLTNLYENCDALEQEIKNLGIEVASTIATNRIQRKQYLSTVVDTLSYMQTYLQELNELNTEGDSLADDINQVLNKSQLDKKTKALHSIK